MKSVENPQLELARSYVEETGVSVFLTGKAGTGKTTFLHNLAQHTSKRHVVLAPTGVAAVNAGGQTIHSFFCLPLCPFLPDVPELITEYQMPEKHKHLRKARIDAIRTLDLLIIDEISMVRADLLDAVDDTLRRYRHSSRPFGGVQLLMIGDVQQLPPVVTDEEQPYISKVYPSPFFFYSKALQRLQYVTIELKQIFRQQDRDFVDLLNNIRDNHLDADTLQKLNNRCKPSFEPPDGQGWIRLTTHNRQSDAVNRRKLEALKGKELHFDARVEGNFAETSFPTEQRLILKKGAQVMFVKNDSSGGHRYYNGKIAEVVGYDADDEVIQVVDTDGETIEVGRETWENVKYEVSSKSGEIRPLVDGTFEQYPLRLAWAITIHKSQGLTFDHLVVDASMAFAYGQVYVALSRCRTLEGLVLSTPITERCAFDNRMVRQFCNSFPDEGQVSGSLGQYRNQYYYDKLFELFDFSALYEYMERLNALYQNHLRILYARKAKLCSELLCGQVADMVSVAERFRKQLLSISQQDGAEALLKERISKAADYFTGLLAEVASKIVTLQEAESDNKEVQAKLKEAFQTLNELLAVKCQCLKQVGKSGFTPADYLSVKNQSLLNASKEETKEEPSSKRKKKDASDKVVAPSFEDVRHPQLAGIIREWRWQKCSEKGVAAFVILTQKSLLAIADTLPRSKKELLSIPGLGKAKVEQYGAELLDLVEDYCREEGL